ncbi:MAG: methionine--tRNA ligase, partial [Pseudomonadota bacterium]
MATESSQAVYITTPIYYVNGTPHIGHAYTSLACDIAARFQRLEGREVKLLTGTDEHGRKVEEAARLAGQSPKDFVERFSADFRRLADAIDCSFDDFIRTTEHRHHRASQAIWRKLAARGDLYKGMYLGWYALRDEAYYTESELITREDGVKIAPSGAEVEWCEEPSWFFRLSDYQKPLLDFYHTNPDFIRPRARMNEVISFVEDGLKDLSVSRANFKWGIPVP